MRSSTLQSNVWNEITKNRIILVLFLLFPIGVVFTEFHHDIFGTGVNALLFNAVFGSYNLFPVIFPIFIIMLVSELNAREWLSDMRTWSIIRLSYKRYISSKIASTVIMVCLYVVIGDILSLIFLMVTHGFNWTTDPKIIAPGLNGLWGSFFTMVILIFIQLLQAIGYALCSLWILQYTKRVWETIVYPFLVIVILPILLFNLLVIPESFIPLTIGNGLIIEGFRLQGWKALGGNLSVWGGLAIIYAFMMTVALQRKRRKGLVR